MINSRPFVFDEVQRLFADGGEVELVYRYATADDMLYASKKLAAHVGENSISGVLIGGQLQDWNGEFSGDGIFIHELVVRCASLDGAMAVDRVLHEPSDQRQAQRVLPPGEWWDYERNQPKPKPKKASAGPAP